MTKGNIERFGYHSADDVRYLEQQQRENETPEKLRKMLESLKKMARSDPSLAKNVQEVEQRLARLLQHA